MHEIEGQMEPDEEEPEVQLAERLVVHSSGRLWEPVVEGRENIEENAADDDVVKVRDHEVRVSKLPIEGRRTKHDPRQARDQKLKQKGNTKQHGSLKVNLSSPYCGEPVEDLDSSGNGNCHGR